MLRKVSTEAIKRLTVELSQSGYEALEDYCLAGLAEFLEDFPHLQPQVLLVLEVIAKAMLDQERTVRAHPAR